MCMDIFGNKLLTTYLLTYYQYTAPVCCNDLPHDIKMSQLQDTFKCNLRHHIMYIN